MVENDRVIDDDDFVEIAKISRVTSQRLRRSGKGPRYMRIGGSQIRYMLSDVMAWLAAQVETKVPEPTEEERALRFARAAKSAQTRRANAAKKAGE